MNISNRILSGIVHATRFKVLCTIALCFTLHPALAINPQPQSMGYETAHDVHLVTIGPQELNALSGLNFNDYSMQAVVNGELAPIPFQFDEKNIQGSIFVPGGGIDIAGQQNIFDAKDQLVFMLRDTGPALEKKETSHAQTDIVAELKITHGSYTGYAYILKGNDSRSPKDYSEFNQEKALFKTDHWSMQASPENFLEWTDFYYESAPANVSMLDVMKLRVVAKVFFTITITNDNVVAKVIAVKNGPVRDIVQLKADIVIAGIPLLDLNVGLEVTPHYLGIPAYAHIPLAAAAIKSPVIKISLDFANMPGAKSRSALGDKRESIADLQLAPYEERMSADKHNSWLAINSQKGFDMLAFIGTTQGDGVELGAFYEDSDKVNKPERFPGTGPELGYTIDNLPAGDDIDFRIDLIYTGGFWDNNNPEEFAKAMKDLPAVSVQ